MARRGFKRRARSFFGKSRAHRSKSSGMSVTNVLLAGVIYGAARPYLAQMLPDLFSFGPVDSDNAIIGAAGMFGMKKSGLWKALGTVALASEVGIVTSRIVTGTASASSSQASGVNAYGL